MTSGAWPLLTTVTPARAQLLRRALRLEYLTLGWNVIEGAIAVAAALAAGSVALLGFGIDSFVESASGCILIWRLLAERRAADQESVEQVERRARKLVVLRELMLSCRPIAAKSGGKFSGIHIYPAAPDESHRFEPESVQDS
jgi:hypothetical protein